jgi:hypothetical protein
MKEYALSPSFFASYCVHVQLHKLHNAELADFCRNHGGFFDIFRHIVKILGIDIKAKGERWRPMQMLVH